jgi:hypothetical protein
MRGTEQASCITVLVRFSEHDPQVFNITGSAAPKGHQEYRGEDFDLRLRSGIKIQAERSLPFQ